MDRASVTSLAADIRRSVTTVRVVVAGLLSLGFGLWVLAADTAIADAQSGTTTFTITARGESGDELIDLVVGDKLIGTWEASLEWQTFSATIKTPKADSTVAVRFPNDAYDPPYDRNLEVDYITVNGDRYDSESPDTVSTGSYLPGVGCQPGNLQTQRLVCEGEFFYNVIVGVGTSDLQTPEGSPKDLVDHCGDITSSQKWRSAKIHVVSCPITVTAGARLTIEPGTVVKVDRSPNAGVMVDAGSTVVAKGTRSNPIVITSWLDDTVRGDSNGDGDATSPAPGDYGSGISIGPGAKLNAENIVVRYASIGIDDFATDASKRGEVNVDRALIENSRYLGIEIDEPRMNIDVTNSTFSNNYFGGARFANGRQFLGFALTGANANTFDGPPASRMLWLTNEFVPKSSSWTFNPATGAILGLENDNSLQISGKVTLLPGSQVKVSPNDPTAGFHVEQGGTLIARGTKAAPIVMTSALDDSVGGDTNADGAASTAAPGSYTSAITMSPDSSVVLDHTSIGYASDGITDQAGANRASSLTVTNSTLHDNNYFGIDINVELTEADVASSTFDNNRLGGAHIAGGASPVDFSMNGANANTFSGPPAAQQLWLGGAVVPAGDSWTFDPATGAILSLEFARSLEVQGRVTIKPGSAIKVSSNSRFAGVTVLNGGVFRAVGTSGDPIWMTSAIDDSVGGDTNADGTTSKPSSGVYRSAIRFTDGSQTTLDHVKIRYARTAISDQASDTDDPATLDIDNSMIRDALYYGILASQPFTTVQADNTTIRQSQTAIGGFDGEVRFRGTIKPAEDSPYAVRACNFGRPCIVDIDQTFWGTDDGPFTTEGNPRVCGQVTINKWTGHAAKDANKQFASLENC